MGSPGGPAGAAPAVAVAAAPGAARRELRRPLRARRVVPTVRARAGGAAAAVAADAYLGDPNRSLPVRRRKMREALAATDEMKELEKLCAALLGTSAPEDEPEAAGTDGA